MGQVNFSSSVFVRVLYNIIRERFTDHTSQMYTDQYPLFAHSTLMCTQERLTQISVFIHVPVDMFLSITCWDKQCHF